MRLRRKDHQPTPAPEPTPEEPDPQTEAALSSAARNFVALTDQAENFDDTARPVPPADDPGPADEHAPTGDLGNDRPDVLDVPGQAAVDQPAAPAAPVPPASPASGPASTKQRRRARVRRVVPAALVVAAIAVPGSGMAGELTGLMWAEQAGSQGGLALGWGEEGGYLPIQDEAPLDDYLDPTQLEAVPVGPEPVAEPIRDVLSSSQVIETLGAGGIPEVALEAYNGAADRLAADTPDCGIRWSLLAAIGRVESNHGRFGGAELRADGYGTRPILGIPLDGRANVALIRDTDGGRLDGDTTFDRAVGPMQFIPSTWRSVGVDANDDGRRDPNNMYDATRGAAGYLCDGGGDLTSIDDQARAVRRYNNADEYVRVVLSLARMYETGKVTPLPALPSLPTPPPLPRPDRGTDPVVDPTPAAPSTPRTTVPRRPPTTTTTTPPRPTTTVPPTTTSTVTPTTVPPTTSTTVPTIEPSTPDTTVPETPTTTVPETPTPEDQEPPAAVGWAPAMREVVVDILDDSADDETPTEDEAPAPASCEPPQADLPTPPEGCAGPEAADGQATPAR
jgi:hypothetical protein